MDIERLETLRKKLKHNIELESEDYWKGLQEEFTDNLRGCDTVPISLSGIGSTEYSTREIYNMMMALEERVVAKSVTSTEVAEAIEYLQPLTEHPTMSGNFAKHLKTAIAALQAYQPWIPELPKGE